MGKCKVITISGYTVVKNEEMYLPYSLGIMDKICDEIIIVDNGSIDRTREIAKSFSKVKLIEKPTDWEERAEIRIIAMKACKCEYIFEWDADEVFYESIVQIRNLLEELDNKFGGICFPYHQFMGDFEHVKDERRANLGGEQHIYGKSLLYRNHKNLKRVGNLHSHVRQSFDPPRIYDFGIRLGFGTNPGNNYYGLMRIQDSAGDNKHLMIDWKKMEPFWFCHFGWCKPNKDIIIRLVQNALWRGQKESSVRKDRIIVGNKTRSFMKEPERKERGTLPKTMKTFQSIPHCKIVDNVIVERSY